MSTLRVPHSATGQIPPNALPNVPLSTRARVRDSVRRSAAQPDDVRHERPWSVRDETIRLTDFRLESGALISALNVHYRLEGELSPARDNLVLVVHALTGTSHAADWWKGVIEFGGAIDPTRHAVLCANLLGGCEGTTGPTNGNPDAIPAFDTRDQAAVLARLLDVLGVQQPLLVCGGSLGGMITLEFAASFPKRVRGAVVLAAPAAQTAQGITWGAIMQRAIAIGGVEDGLALARMVGMLSYRTPEGLERRFGRARNANGAFQVSEWLSRHGERLVQRFDASSYAALLGAMDAHDVGRGRGGITAALAPVANRLTGVGIRGDLLYPAEAVQEWTTAVSASYVALNSVHGHDAFLLETEQVSAILRDAIARAERSHTLPALPPQLDSRMHVPMASGASANARVRAHVWVNARAWPSSQVQSLRVALAGCGHVGGSLLDLLGEQTVSDGPAARVERVLVRDAQRPRPALAQAVARGLAPAAARITDPALLIDEDIDVFVEAIGGTTTARELVENALRRGIRVVTANKALLAKHGARLAALARDHNTRIDFEGAVAGAIPVVRCLRSGATGVGVTGLHGILNGTSNFVLERVADGVSLSDAVAAAQRLGFAEADPARDLSGEDAEDKLRVLAWLAFGVDPASLVVARRGIDEATAVWAARVAGEGDCVKLLATCTMRGGELVAGIAPTRVMGVDAWARVTGADNRIVIESSSAGSLVLQGRGASGRATAGAVLADLLTPAQ